MPSANDHLSSALVLSGASGHTTLNFTGADFLETGEATWWGGPHKSLWFRWTAPADGEILFTLGAGAPAEWDICAGSDASDFASFVGGSLTSGWQDRPVDCHFPVTSGQTYLLFVDDYSYETGSPPATAATLTWAAYVPPPTAGSWVSSGSYSTSILFPGDNATVAGTGLDTVTTVTVGGVTQGFTVTSSTQLVVHITGSAVGGPIVVANATGSATALGDATVYHYGPWTQPDDLWGPERDQTVVPTIVVTQSRTFAVLDDPTPDVWYDGPDTSQPSPAAPSSRPTGGSFGWDLLQSGDYQTSSGPDHIFGHLNVDAGYVDVNNASSDDRGQLMPAVNPFTAGLVTDPHAVDYEIEPSSYVIGTFAGRVRYRLHVLRNNQEIFAPRDYDGSPHHPAWDWHGQLRRLLPGDYNVWAGPGTDVFPAWLFPGDLAARDVVLDFSDRAPGDIVHVAVGDGTYPDTALSDALNLYEGAGGAPSFVDLGAVELVADDPGDIVGLIATTSGYAAGDRPSALTPSDPAGPHDSNVDLPWQDPADNKYKLGGQYNGGWGPWTTLWSVYYAPPRYRIIYDTPQTATLALVVKWNGVTVSSSVDPSLPRLTLEARALYADDSTPWTSFSYHVARTGSDTLTISGAASNVTEIRHLKLEVAEESFKYGAYPQGEEWPDTAQDGGFGRTYLASLADGGTTEFTTGGYVVVSAPMTVYFDYPLPPPTPEPTRVRFVPVR